MTMNVQTTLNTLDRRMDDWRGTPRQLWQGVTNEMAAQVNRVRFKTYFEPLELTDFDGDTFTVRIGADKIAWCEQFATSSLERALKRELARKVTVLFAVRPEAQPQLPMFVSEQEAIDVGEDDSRAWW
jgi:chromosomal replication initiation ATPase DnaA